MYKVGHCFFCCISCVQFAILAYEETLGLDVWDPWAFFKLLDTDGGSRQSNSFPWFRMTRVDKMKINEIVKRKAKQNDVSMPSHEIASSKEGLRSRVESLGWWNDHRPLTVVAVCRRACCILQQSSGLYTALDVHSQTFSLQFLQQTDPDVSWFCTLPARVKEEVLKWRISCFRMGGQMWQSADWWDSIQDDSSRAGSLAIFSHPIF